MHKITVLITIVLLTSGMISWGVQSVSTSVQIDSSFTFASIADSNNGQVNFSQTINQIESLNPDFVIFSGDVENDGVVTSEMDPITGVLKNAGLFDGTFIVRGNHDNHVTDSASLWQTYFTNQFGGSTRPLPSGVSNFVSIDSNSTYLTYSFDYGNSRFIGVDVPGNAGLITSAEYTFLDNRLSNAESAGLTHAFIFFHGPEYCVEDTHCSCTTKTDSSCTPSNFITLVNNHPIVSATFHGHEHVLGHVHMDNTRIAALTHSYEEFFTSSAGGPYSFTMYPDRIDDNYSSSSLMSFGMITVNENDYTVSLFHTGTSSPVWSHTFNNPYHPTPTRTSTPSSTPTEMPTNTSTPTETPTPTPTPTQIPVNPQVVLASFTAAWTGSQVNVNWATTTEIDNSDFNLYRSTDLITWVEVISTPSMRQCGNYTMTSPEAYSYADANVEAGTPYYYKLYFSGEECGAGVTMSPMVAQAAPTQNQSLSLSEGWNLVSFRVHPPSTAVADVLANVDGSYDLVYAWDASGDHSATGNWVRYAPAIPVGNTLETLDETQGFWIHMTSADVLEINGTAPATSIDLFTGAGGWNLVGFPHTDTHDLPEALSSHGVSDFNLVYAYHASDTGDPWKRYAASVPIGNDLAGLTPGWGYWVKVGSAGIWHVEY